MTNRPMILNERKENCYISGNKIFILSEISDKTCGELIGNLSNLVDSLEYSTMQQNYVDIIGETPYTFKYDKKPQVIDIYINSGGGNLYTTKSILMLLNLARNKGAIIRTTVMGIAASCASIIAIQGTKGFRVMYEQSYNLVHYGNSSYQITKPSEAEKAAKYENEMRKNFYSPYLRYTELTQQELKKLQQTEYNFLSAQECLNKKLCDWVLTTDGIFIKSEQKTR